MKVDKTLRPMMRLATTVVCASVGLTLASMQSASAHTTRLGWKAVSGGLDFYGTTYHPLNFSADDFVNNPSGIVLNGTQFAFDQGSAVASTYTDWQNLLLDNELECQGTSNACSDALKTTDLQKRASVFLSSSVLDGLGLNPGSNTVSFDTFGPNFHWIPAGTGFGVSSIDIVLPPDPPTTAVPTPALLPGLLGMAGAVLRKKKSLADAATSLA